MEDDLRERRDPLDPDAQPRSEEPADTAAVTPDEAASEPPPAESAPAEIESWPSQDAAATEPIGEEPAEPAASWQEPTSEPAWPTEPPAAGSASEETWPTTPPEQGDEPILAPDATDAAATAAAAQTSGAAVPPATEPGTEPATEQAEPPPEEVEAYPAAAAAGATAAAAHTVPEGETATGESTQCPRCGTENRPGLAFCRNCGQRLVAAGVATTVERPGTPEGTMACPRCGTHNRSGVAFCQNCGANLRGTAPGYVPPAAAAAAATATSDAQVGRQGAVLGPVVLIIGIIGLVTAYFLPFAYGTGSLFERAFGDGGYGVAFWTAYDQVGGSIADSAYFGLAAAVPLLAVILLGLAVAGFMYARPGPAQTAFLVIALVWSVALIVMFLVAEVFANWNGDLVGLLRELTPAGIIFFLSSLIVLIGTLTRFARS